MASPEDYNVVHFETIIANEWRVYPEPYSLSETEPLAVFETERECWSFIVKTLLKGALFSAIEE